MYLTRLKTSVIAIFCLCLCGAINNSNAELMVPMQSSETPTTKLPTDRKLGGSIAKIDENGIEINAVYYPFSSSGVKIHAMNGKLAQLTDLKPGMLVSFSVTIVGQSTKIREIWVLKNE